MKLNSINIALNHQYSFKGLDRPRMYDTPLTPMPRPPEGKEVAVNAAR